VLGNGEHSRSGFGYSMRRTHPRNTALQQPCARGVTVHGCVAALPRPAHSAGWARRQRLMLCLDRGLCRRWGTVRTEHAEGSGPPRSNSVLPNLTSGKADRVAPGSALVRTGSGFHSENSKTLVRSKFHATASCYFQKQNENRTERPWLPPSATVAPNRVRVLWCERAFNPEPGRSPTVALQPGLEPRLAVTRRPGAGQCGPSRPTPRLNLGPLKPQGRLRASEAPSMAP
jgi:hypothetical protein